MKTINFKVDDDLSPQQVLGRQHEQEIERIKILRNIKKKAIILQENKNRFTTKPIIQNEVEFIRRLDTANLGLVRNKERMAILHKKKYFKKWKNPSIMRLTRSKDFFIPQ